VYVDSLIFSVAPKGWSRIGMEDATMFFRMQRCRGKQQELSSPSPFPWITRLYVATKPFVSTDQKDLTMSEKNLGYIFSI
jgi:hypothetical protein